MRAKCSISVLAALAVSLAVAASAGAAGAGNVVFDVEGTLPKFPCPEGCTASFTGEGDGAGTATATIGGATYAAVFTITDGQVNGTASYAEPAGAFCPLLGSATSPTTGSVTLADDATGVIYRTSSPTFTGTVHSASTTLDYTYQRVGVLSALTITGGSVTVNYFYPGTGQGSFTQQLAVAPGVGGAGAGVFQVILGNAIDACESPTDLEFRLTGDAAVAGT